MNGDVGEREHGSDGKNLEETVLLSCDWLFAGLIAADDKIGLGIDRDVLAMLRERRQALPRRHGG